MVAPEMAQAPQTIDKSSDLARTNLGRHPLKTHFSLVKAHGSFLLMSSHYHDRNLLCRGIPLKPQPLSHHLQLKLRAVGVVVFDRYGHYH